MWWSECFLGLGILLLLFFYPVAAAKTLPSLCGGVNVFSFLLFCFLPCCCQDLHPTLWGRVNILCSSSICGGVNVLCSPNICDGVNVLLPFCCQDLHPKYVVEVMFFVHPTYMVDWLFHALWCCLLTLCCQFNAFFFLFSFLTLLLPRPSPNVHCGVNVCVHPVYIWWSDCLCFLLLLLLLPVCW